MCKLPSVQKWIKECDHIMYHTAVKNLIPDPLQQIPTTMSDTIKNLQDQLDYEAENVLKQTLIPEKILEIKVLFCW